MYFFIATAQFCWAGEVNVCPITSEATITKVDCNDARNRSEECLVLVDGFGLKSEKIEYKALLGADVSDEVRALLEEDKQVDFELIFSCTKSGANDLSTVTDPKAIWIDDGILLTY